MFEMFKERKGQVAPIVAVILGVIMLVGVAIPVSTDVITDANLTGTAATLVDFVPVALGLGALVLGFSIVSNR